MENSRKRKRAAKTEEGTTTISFSILPSQKAILEKMANEKDKSISAILRRVIAVQIEKWKEEGIIDG